MTRYTRHKKAVRHSSSIGRCSRVAVAGAVALLLLPAPSSSSIRIRSAYPSLPHQSTFSNVFFLQHPAVVLCLLLIVLFCLARHGFGQINHCLALLVGPTPKSLPYSTKMHFPPSLFEICRPSCLYIICGQEITYDVFSKLETYVRDCHGGQG